MMGPEGMGGPPHHMQGQVVMGPNGPMRITPNGPVPLGPNGEMLPGPGGGMGGGMGPGGGGFGGPRMMMGPGGPVPMSMAGHQVELETNLREVRCCIITPSRSLLPWLKVATTAFTFKTQLRKYA